MGAHEPSIYIRGMQLNPLEISEICRVVQEVQEGGGCFHSFQPACEDYLVLFNHPESRTTLALPISEISVAAVREKVASVRERDADKIASM